MTSDPLMMQHIGAGATRSPEEQKRSFSTWLTNHTNHRPFGFRIAIRKSDNERIGHMGFLKASIEGREYAEVAYWVARRFWGNGYAREAAQSIIDEGAKTLTSYKELISIIRPNNTASRKVAESLGMRAAFETTYSGGLAVIYSMDHCPVQTRATPTTNDAKTIERAPRL